MVEPGTSPSRADSSRASTSVAPQPDARVDVSATQAANRPGAEDVLIIPLVVAALAAKCLAQAVLSILIRLLDWGFVFAVYLTRFPLFVVKVLGDGVIAVVSGLLAWLPVPEENRRKWRELIAQNWGRIRQTISYKAFEQAVHHAFERGMEWVFRKCRRLTPRGALYVIAGAALWLPVSFGAATAMHALLLAKAAVLPPWMQLLHPFATLLAKSKLLVLPAYPAAWPQAKKHPLIQAIAHGYRDFERLSLIQKMELRYRQAEHAADRAVETIQRLAVSVGLDHVFGTLWVGLTGVNTRIANALRHAMLHGLRRLSAARLIGPAAARYLRDLERASERNEKASEMLRGAFARWSIKFSAEYYEAKEREEAAKAASAKMLGGSAAPTG
jgi:hypothetical protein